MPKVLVVGSGGREHAMVRALARSPQAPEVHVAPGNPGIVQDAVQHGVAVDDIDGLIELARTEQIDLVAVGPEVPLVAGLVDRLSEAGIPAFGPTAAAAKLEGSKAFAKEVMNAAGVPTAGHTTVTTVADGMAVIKSYPVVLKYDGLAAGKGVVIAESNDQAFETLSSMLEDQQFGEASVVVEDFLIGEELSLLAICDGVTAIPLASAQDYKRIFDNDEGPNTGGMGSYSPVAGIESAVVKAISQQVHQPIVDEMARRGTPFHGVLYAGLMVTGMPEAAAKAAAGGQVDVNDLGLQVLEYNARFGDPETQAVLPRLRSDLYQVMLSATKLGGLATEPPLSWDPRWAVTLVLASAGYPESASKDDVIEGLKDVQREIEVTHAGTAVNTEGQLVTAGGRVLNLTALGSSPADARAKAYEAASKVNFAGKQQRSDIALRAEQRA